MKMHISSLQQLSEYMSGNIALSQTFFNFNCKCSPFNMIYFFVLSYIVDFSITPVVSMLLVIVLFVVAIVIVSIVFSMGFSLLY